MALLGRVIVSTAANFLPSSVRTSVRRARRLLLMGSRNGEQGRPTLPSLSRTHPLGRLFCSGGLAHSRMMPTSPLSAKCSRSWIHKSGVGLTTKQRPSDEDLYLLIFVVWKDRNQLSTAVLISLNSFVHASTYPPKISHRIERRW